jgi:hypothetical protein
MYCSKLTGVAGLFRRVGFAISFSKRFFFHL